MRTSNWDFGNAGAFTTRQISSGHTRGSTTITLTSAPTGLTSGRILFIVAPASGTTIDGNGGWTDFLGTYPFVSVLRVTGVTGNDVTFTPAIDADYISSLTCHVYYRTAADQIDFSGLENLKVRVASGGFFNGDAVLIHGANQCWFRNVFFNGMGAPSSLNAFIWFYGAYNCEIFKCSFSGCSAPGNSSLYAISSLNASGLLIANNNFDTNSNVYPLLSTSRTAFVYNYCHDMNYGSTLSQWVFHHGSHNHYNLFEGNYIQGQHYNDESNAGNFTHSRNTLYFRERIFSYDNSGNSSGFPLNNVNAIVCQDHHDNVTVAGCVMGTDGKGDGVTGGNGTGQGENQGYIYNFDATSTSTLQKFANHNRFDDAIPAGEALSGGDALVMSYVYSSKPSWFGDRPWPWVDPVTNSTSLATTTFTNLPSGYRFAFGEDPPSGLVVVSNAIITPIIRIGTLRY